MHDDQDGARADGDDDAGGGPARRARTSTPRNELERQAWPDLPAALVERLRDEGETRDLAPGDVLFEVGQPSYDFAVLEEGTIDIVDRAGDEVIVSIEAPNFVGELGMLMGQGTFLAGVARTPVRAVVVPQDRLRALVATVPEIADVVVTAFAARRRLLLEWNEGGLVIVGREGDADTVRLLGFASRNRIPHRFVDRADEAAIADLAARCDLPESGAAVVTGRSDVLADPEPRDLARALGMDLPVQPSAEAPGDATTGGRIHDLAVIGAGPAGLAAAVYGASEGLSTIVIEDTAIGGQAGTSSRIENYLGFSTGVSGSELAYQGEIQAIKFGARFAVPRHAVGLTPKDGHHAIELDDGTCVRARAVVLAPGVQYRRLNLDRLEAFEGAGIYYAATDLEARFCHGTDAVIVGGGNSAGQAAMFLSRVARRAHVLVRGDGLAATMSSYLSDRIHSDPRIRLWTSTEIAALHGEDRLEAVTVRDNRTGEESRIDTRALFVMVGASPRTGWLDGHLALDRSGFVLTGGQAMPGAARWSDDPFATSLEGVWTVGDLRAGSVKRVASAVGEGSVVVSAVHAYLADGAAAPRATAAAGPATDRGEASPAAQARG